MKKKFRTRIIAGMLTVITVFSTAGAVITPVCAAEVNSNAVKNVSACDVVEMIDKMVDIAVDDSTPMVKLMASGGMEVLRQKNISCAPVQASAPWELWDVDTPEKMEKVRGKMRELELV